MPLSTILPIVFMLFLIGIGAIPVIGIVQMSRDNKKKYGTYSLPKSKLNKGK